MMKRFRFIIVLFVLAGMLLAACGTNSKGITEDMDGQTVSVKVGDTFNVRLQGNPTTGYNWVMADYDSSVVSQVGDVDYHADSLLTGSGGTYIYQFKALTTGTTMLTFNYLRSWEKGVPPYKTFKITIEVK